MLGTPSNNNMNGDIFTIEGIEETCMMLQHAPALIASGAFLKALQAASNVIRDELEPRVPYDPEATGNAAHGGLLGAFGQRASGPKGGGYALRENVTTDIVLDQQGRGGSLDIGFGSLGHIALWLEYGHDIVTHFAHKAEYVTKSGKVLRSKWGDHKVVGHAAPNPFMRNATDASAERAIDAACDSLKKSMQEGIPGVPTEGRAA